MTERTPLVGGGGSINSTGGGSSFLATINDADEDLLGVESGDSVGKGHEENTKNELGVSLFFFYFPPCTRDSLFSATTNHFAGFPRWKGVDQVFVRPALLFTGA